MRSQKDYIVTKHDAYRLAELWLGKALKFNYKGTKCDGRILLQVLLLFIGVALVLRNVWVWLHFQFAKNKWAAEPKLHLRLLRFREMLHWIEQVVETLLAPDRPKASNSPITNNLRHMVELCGFWNY